MPIPRQQYTPLAPRSTLPSPNPLSLTLPTTPDHPPSPPPLSPPSPSFHPTDFASTTSSDLDDDSDLSNPDPDSDSASATTLNYFVHNGYRYDGDIFQLRPPQERSIASRPERVLEHKPPLLNNRQVFNRVYSEGTYSTRPSSLRQPNRNSNRYSTSTFASSDDELHPANSQPIRLDAPRIPLPPPLPVTRPGSVRPAPLSTGRFCRTIEAVRVSATEGNANHNLYGSLAYSQVPVTKISGHKPDLLSSSSANVACRRVRTDTGKRTIPCVRSGTENVNPFAREKRGRSYSGAGAAGSATGARPKRSLFWRGRLLSR